MFLLLVEGERLFEAGGPVGNSADTAVLDFAGVRPSTERDPASRTSQEDSRGPALDKRQTCGGESKIRCAPSRDSCQQRAWLRAVLSAGIGRDSRLLSADGTASVSLRTLIRPAQEEGQPAYT